MASSEHDITASGMLTLAKKSQFHGEPAMQPTGIDLSNTLTNTPNPNSEVLIKQRLQLCTILAGELLERPLIASRYSPCHLKSRMSLPTGVLTLNTQNSGSPAVARPRTPWQLPMENAEQRELQRARVGLRRRLEQSNPSHRLNYKMRVRCAREYNRLHPIEDDDDDWEDNDDDSEDVDGDVEDIVGDLQGVDSTSTLPHTDTTEMPLPITLSTATLEQIAVPCTVQ